MNRTPIPLNEIVFLKADANYTEFHLVGGRKTLSPRTLKHHENMPAMRHFLRVSHSFLLNPAYIYGISRINNMAVVHLADGTRVQASRRRQNVLKELEMANRENVVPPLQILATKEA